MRSPSSFSVILTVPCVDGCEGPIWISIGCVWRSSTSGGSIGPAAIALLLARLGTLGLLRRDVARSHERLALLFRVVLAQRIPLELFVEVDPPQIRMSVEDDPVHVVGFSLEPVRAAPHGRHRLDVRAL